MTRFRLGRRTVLRGAGSIAVALPWLEAMEPERAARAAGNPAKRFLAVFTPGGTVLQPANKWRPSGTETAPILSPILAPLEPVKSKLLVVDGLDMKSAVGEQHQAGIITWLTGSEQAGGGYARSPSIDQMIATRISAGGKKKIPSLQLAVRWGTGKAHGLLSPISAATFEDNAANPSPIPPSLDPQKVWKDVFGALDASAANAQILERKMSILDFLNRKYAALSARLGAADRQKIDQHLTKIRELEAALGAVSNGTATCALPARVDTKDYKPDTALQSADDGSLQDISTDRMIPTVGTFMMDMMVMALACDLTAVGTLQWTDTEAKHTFPWLNLPEHHHFYQHDGGFRPDECERIYTWYSKMHLHLLQAMDKVDMGGHTLLDESVVFFGSELADPPSHSKTDMPFLVAGRGGGLRGGRWVKHNRRPHNDLLVAILHLFGDPRTTVGPAQYNTGALTNLT